MLWHFCSKRKSYQSVISHLSTIQFIEAMSNKRSASLLDDFKIAKRLVIVKYKVHYPTEYSFPDLTISKFVVTKVFSLQKLIPNLSQRDVFADYKTFLPFMTSKQAHGKFVNKSEASSSTLRKAGITSTGSHTFFSGTVLFLFSNNIPSGKTFQGQCCCCWVSG